MTHSERRETYRWGTYGKNGDEPLTHILLKNISDDHLENIIDHIKLHNLSYNNLQLMIMTEEKFYRRTNNISVPEYDLKVTKKTFIKSLK